MSEQEPDVDSSAEIEQVYERMGLPSDGRLGKRVYKKLFAENAKLGGAEKKALKEDVDKVVWLYKLDPTTVSIPAFADHQREYLEVAVVQVGCKTQKRTGRIAQIIHRAIPYPLLIVFSHERSVAFSLAHKRFSQSEKDASVAEEFSTSSWIDLTCPTDVQASFLDSMNLGQLPKPDLFTFYSAMVDRIVALDCSRFTGAFVVREQRQEHATRCDSLAKCHQLESQINQLRSEIKKEDQFNRRVELNIKIKELEKQLKETTENL